MTSIEERFARDIAAVTGGVVVTESDLAEARSAVNERIQSKGQRNRVRTLSAAAAAVVVLAAVGVTAFLTQGGDDDAAPFADPTPTVNDSDASYLTGSAPTPQLLAGVWRLDNGTTQFKFDENGTVWVDDRGRLYSDPRIMGTYVIDGDRITVTKTKDSQAECVGTKLSMRASLPERGLLHFVPSGESDACSFVSLPRGALEQVLPTSAEMAALTTSTDPGWTPLPSKAALYGVWMAERGGHVLEMDPDGSYFIADESAALVDQGKWTLKDADLTLTSSVASTKCSAGDRFVLGALQYVNLGTGSFRGTMKQNGCGGAWTPAAWVLIPHVGS